jgi:iron complex outermembrane receptor protein
MRIGDCDSARYVRWIGAGGGALLLFAAILVLAPAVGWSQETPPAEPAATPAPASAAEEGTPEGTNIGFEEEVTVTARKLGEESAQDVPVSVAAPSEEQLRNRGAQTLEDVSLNVAGFSVQNLGPGQSQVAMRGVSAGQIVRDQPGVKEQVGVYLDESAISMSLFTPDIDLFDLSRVEVLRGPQGTVFGAGSLSGTVRYITNQPELGRSQQIGEFSLTNASGGGFGGAGKVTVNAPVGDTAALRVTAYYTGYAGYMDAVQPAGRIEDVNSGSRAGARIALRAEPNDNFTITPRLVYQKVDMNGWNRIDIYNILANPFTTTRPQVRLGEREHFTQFEEPFTDEFLLGDLTAEYKFSDRLSLTSITSYADRDILVIRDSTQLTASVTGDTIGLPESIYTLSSPLNDATKAKAWTQELRLAGGSDKLRWVGGAFYADGNRDYGQDLFVAGFERLSGIHFNDPVAGVDHLFFSDLHYKLKQKALFGEGTWAINDRFDLSGGVRYYDFDENRSLVFAGAFADAANSKDSVSADGFAPRLIASMKLGDATRLNAQVSKGFRLGGINDPLNVPLCAPQDITTFGGHPKFEDETAWNYEVGTKSTVMGGRGTVNVSAYYMDIDDLQATMTAGQCSSRIILNVPSARSQGLELEIAAAPTSTFDVSFSASYNNSELTSSIKQGNTFVGGVREGNRLPNVPELQAALAATWQKPVNETWLGFVTGTYQHVGSRFTQLADEEPGFGTITLRQGIGGPLTQTTFSFDGELPAYDLLNLRLGVLRDAVEVAFFVNNVTDERALLSLDRERGLTARIGYLTNEPRTFGVSTRLTFH